ncbi:TonB-dependent siderophore receptor [Methylophilus sp. 13]|uniref:TonB-dependent receptor n=1 Tax=Methylophilus sp. 13 TaxID=2781018 RepID=UPI00188F70CF|nr:TonB-dependent siderophore receptor [Methylophilus sp. 13]MBF5040169.1 TonB-dependent siderophore receptor [Methylophilus sp. 13]
MNAYKKVLIAVMYATVFMDASAEESELDTLGEVKVKASADANAKGLMKPYAGGQVAKGGRVGVLGNKDAMDTPFSINAYTNELIQNQQAKSVGDVLLNDPSVRVARGFGNFQESYFIRGFQLYSDSVAYNGLYGILPRQYIAAELFERVEVLRGASAFLNGTSPNGDAIGGSISLLPKRAPNEPLSVVNAGWSSGNQQLISADVARRFGPDDSAGIRLNVSRRDGGTAVDKEHAEVDLISLALDWRGENLRLSGDIGYQDNHLKQTRTNVTLAASTGVPRAPSSDSNWAQPWSYSNERDTFGTLRGEYDLTDKVTAYFAGGFRESHEANSLANLTVNNSATGTGTFYRFDNTREDSVRTGEVGLKGKFETGSISHDVVLNANLYHFEKKAAYTFDSGNQLNTNLYAPTYYALPAFTAGAGSGGVLDNPNTTGRTILRSLAIGDTLAMLDNQLLLTLGVRSQQIAATTYDYNGVFSSAYDKTKLSPVLGAVVKPWDGISLYANYIEGLSQGATAPGTTANRGETLAPYVSKQKEVGAKFDFGKVRVTTAYFTTEKPRGFINAANVFTSQGKEEHQGVELMTYGQISPSLRVLGGITWLDAKQKNTGNASTEDKQTIGIPDQQANLGLEWDAFMVPGLTFDARVITTGHVYGNGTNTQRLPGWTRLDIGARYATEIEGHLLTVRGRIDNITDRDYWASAGGYAGLTSNSGYLVLGAPRTITVSAQLDF